MKIAVIQGSPHKSGSSNMLADAFIKGAREAGHSIETLDAAHMDIHPCTGCQQCGMDGHCSWRDDNQKIKKALLSCDLAVFVTPVYYFGMSAQLKAVIDRFYSYTLKLSSRHLKKILITASWDAGKDVMPYLQSHYEKLCRYMNFENVGEILGTGCGTPAMTKRSKHMKSAYLPGKTI